ncbi:T-cell surface glycoprotein CD3 gamma chain [Stegastes partitus]|uniref:CD3g molecule n=1 Tax=Stegastes partitus TaxID=144197 RepID=A0A3B5BD27_9TELE|nr:PREDICTED: T-cell surface glycoprotein CD3 gamma chain [Stegastes partitus]XP_008296898.1 PREDICTED: T-cell surface glycoprotein CD3 gamma chain [Stegastes partitus]
MKCQQLALLLLWGLIAFVSICESQEIKVEDLFEKIKLSCGSGYKMQMPNGTPDTTLTVPKLDSSTGEYACVKDGDNEPASKIFVKFRSCDNCIELNKGEISGVVVAEVVATVVIGVAVYLVASQMRTGSAPSNKKTSDRQHLVSNEVRSTNDHYQPLRRKDGNKDTYDVLNKK